MAGKRPKRARCAWCKSTMKISARGRRPTFCSQSCRQQGYEKRKQTRLHPLELLARDIATAQVRSAIRHEVWAILQQLGWVSESAPPPKLQKRPKPTFVAARYLSRQSFSMPPNSRSRELGKRDLDRMRLLDSAA